MPSVSTLSPRALAQALLACFSWSLFPLYFALLHEVSPFEVVAWRVLFALPCCAAALAVLRQGEDVLQALRSPRMLGTLALSGLLIGVNWLVYVLAVMEGHVLAASLGYYICPLVNVLSGAVFLRERLSRRRGTALALAAIGVAMLARDALPTLWISTTLALSFGGYALTRKLAPVSALSGLTVETLVLALPAIGLLAWQATGAAGLGIGASLRIDLLLAGAGPLTALPLLLFASAARKLDLSVLGFLQFVTPSGLFLIGFFAFGEPLRPVQALCFLFIWAAIAVFCWDLLAQRRTVPA